MATVQRAAMQESDVDRQGADSIDPLSLIAMRCGGDKFGAHLYTPIYHRLFAHLRERPLRLLEIGIGGYGDARAGGASLLTWAAYFPQATIVGLDLAEKRLALPAGVRVVQGAQNDPVVLRRIVDEHGPFDIVIDDASHHVALTQQTFLLLYPTLRPDGIYVVEDTQTAFHEGHGGRPDGRHSMFELAQAVGLAMHSAEGYRAEAPAAAWLARFGAATHAVSVFRNLIVFQRGDNTYPSNVALDFAHPGVRRTYATMEAIAAGAPSPRDSLARIDMNIWGKRYDAAAELAMAAARRYPDDAPLLHELRYMMVWAGRTAELARIDTMLAAVADEHVKQQFPPGPDKVAG